MKGRAHYVEIKITEDAFTWFHNEMEVESGDTVRFFVRYGGAGNLQPGFSLGVTKDEPDEAAVKIEQDQVTYYIEERDIWYFDGHDLVVSVNDDLHELDYSYEKEKA
ncbi:Iron-sulfur cluster biosynthesis [Planococcus massiliensis]|uniref:Iron-sulfur cluster biosynthesis n=1 Tax=Planococcus massiliensis TaxID=1499687 RepID=A0A098EM42_9BACL|nr:HesB/YadR/YfhF family protein [Planococcus ruber]CEG22877.1 Iron-sulfur cluster biosynthesis [Planococcus massiliensis]